MKRIMGFSFSGLIFVLLGFVPFVFAQNEAGTLNTEARQQRQEVKRNLDQALQRIDSALVEMRIKMQDVQEKSKPKVDEAINKLEKIKDDMNKKMKKVDAIADKKWKSFRKNAENAIKNADDKLAKIKKDIRDESSDRNK